MIVILTHDDGTEIWYDVEDITLSHNPVALSERVLRFYDPGIRPRPEGNYVTLNGCRLERIVPGPEPVDAP